MLTEIPEGGIRWLRCLAWGLLVFSVVEFGRELEVTYYGDWPYDMSTKTFAGLIVEDGNARRRPIRIAATWLFEPSLNFYRDRYRAPWIDPVTRAEPSPGFDYYVLAAEDRQFLTRFRLRPILTDAFGSVLAVPDGTP